MAALTPVRFAHGTSLWLDFASTPFHYVTRIFDRKWRRA
jgi:hypothetical protein